MAKKIVSISVGRDVNLTNAQNQLKESFSDTKILESVMESKWNGNASKSFAEKIVNNINDSVFNSLSSKGSGSGTVLGIMGDIENLILMGQNYDINHEYTKAINDLKPVQNNYKVYMDRALRNDDQKEYKRWKKEYDECSKLITEYSKKKMEYIRKAESYANKIK